MNTTTSDGRVLFVLPFAGGNVLPTLAIASALADAGHEAQVMGHPQLKAAVLDARLRFQPFEEARPWSPIVDQPGLVSMLQWLRLASDRGIARDLAIELKRAPVDAVVVDCMIPVALPAARRSGSKVVLLLHAFSTYWLEQWAWSSPMGIRQRCAGVHPSRAPADLAIVTTSPTFDGIKPDLIPAARVEQTGPVLPERGPPQPATGSERVWDVLLSFSTISYPEQDAVLQRTLDAIGSLQVSAVATVAPSMSHHSLRFPQNVERRLFVPHRELLPFVRLVVGHGGHGTTMSALSYGVPVLVIAMSPHADQPLVGAAVEKTGVGLTLSRQATTQEIRSAISSLLADRIYAERAAKLSAEWRNSNGATSAPCAIASLFASPEQQNL